MSIFLSIVEMCYVLRVYLENIDMTFVYFKGHFKCSHFHINFDDWNEFHYKIFQTNAAIVNRRDYIIFSNHLSSVNFQLQNAHQKHLRPSNFRFPW